MGEQGSQFARGVLATWPRGLHSATRRQRPRQRRDLHDHGQQALLRPQRPRPANVDPDLPDIGHGLLQQAADGILCRRRNPPKHDTGRHKPGRPYNLSFRVALLPSRRRRACRLPFAYRHPGVSRLRCRVPSHALITRLRRQMSGNGQARTAGRYSAHAIPTTPAKTMCWQPRHAGRFSPSIGLEDRRNFGLAA